MRYRILADNAVDVIAHLRERKVVWISQSAETAFGWPLEQWIGSDFGSRIYAGDIDAVVAILDETTHDTSSVARCRVYATEGGYRWVELRESPMSTPRATPMECSPQRASSMSRSSRTATHGEPRTL